MGLSRDKNDRLRRMRTVLGINPPSRVPEDVEFAVVERRRRLCGPNNDRIRTGVDVPTPDCAVAEL